MRTLLVATMIFAASAAFAQQPTGAQPAPAPTPAPAAAAAATAPDKLVLYFEPGSATVRAKDVALLDQASRLYRDGHPILMLVTGGSDSTGDPSSNLRLSAQRATNVVRGLVARGIPAERFQILAKGSTDPAIPESGNTPEERNRRVEITWR